MTGVLLVLFYLAFPAVVLYADSKLSVVRKVGPVVICYATGLLLGNVGRLPDGFEAVQDTLITIVVPLAIPLLLFSFDVRAWLGMAGKTALSLALGLASVVVVVLVGYLLFRQAIPAAWKVAGMLVAVYSGGTPNVASIKIALDVDPGIFLLTHIYDLSVGAVTLLFLLTIARRTFLLLLRPYPAAGSKTAGEQHRSYAAQYESIAGIFEKRTLLPLLAAVGLSALIFAAAGAVGLLLPDSAQLTAVILIITSLGMACSFVPRIRRIEKTFQAGMYLVLVFSIIVASMADFSLFSLDSWPLLAYVALTVWGALLLHGLLSRIFDIDADSFLIVSTALIMSPPFVPVVASALRNRDIILPGLVTGIIGYAAGNYLGVAVAQVLRYVA